MARFIEAFCAAPRPGEVYNIGGGRANSCSVLEAIEAVQALTGKRMNYEYLEKNREGDHICYISNLRKIRSHYPSWDIGVPLPQILEQIVRSWRDRGAH